jgi:hypothetical protein
VPAAEKGKGSQICNARVEGTEALGKCVVDFLFIFNYSSYLKY